MLSDHNGIKLEKNRETREKSINTWKIDDTQALQWIKLEV
jgi:hypothetical protein